MVFVRNAAEKVNWKEGDGDSVCILRVTNDEEEEEEEVGGRRL